MKPKDIIMHIADNKLYLYKNKLYVETLKNNVIYNGKVSKPQEFSNLLEKILKKYKLNNNFFNNSIVFITSPNYTQADTEVINKIFERNNVNKIYFVNIINLIDIKKNKVWIIKNNYYIYLVYLNYKQKTESIFIDLKLYQKNIDLLIETFKLFIKNKQTILLGFSDKLEQFAELIESRTSIKTYYITNTFEYINNKLKNTLNN